MCKIFLSLFENSKSRFSLFTNELLLRTNKMINVCTLRRVLYVVSILSIRKIVNAYSDISNCRKKRHAQTNRPITYLT